MVLERPESPVMCLTELSKVFGPLDEASARFLFRQVVKAAKHCHACDIVHADIKLNKVIVQMKTGRAILIDFGHAFKLNQGLGWFRGKAGKLHTKVGVHIPSLSLSPVPWQCTYSWSKMYVKNFYIGMMNIPARELTYGCAPCLWKIKGFLFEIWRKSYGTLFFVKPSGHLTIESEHVLRASLHTETVSLCLFTTHHFMTPTFGRPSSEPTSRGEKMIFNSWVTFPRTLTTTPQVWTAKRSNGFVSQPLPSFDGNICSEHS